VSVSVSRGRKIKLSLARRKNYLDSRVNLRIQVAVRVICWKLRILKTLRCTRIWSRVIKLLVNLRSQPRIRVVKFSILRGKTKISLRELTMGWKKSRLVSTNMLLNSMGNREFQPK
jgi:hypothetical protein